MKLINKKCPICGSDNLIRIKALTSEDAEIKLNNKDYSHLIEEEQLGMMVEDENDFVKLNFIEEKKNGVLLVCKDCNFDFREFVDYSKIKDYCKTKITKEEFVKKFKEAMYLKLSKQILDDNMRTLMVETLVEKANKEIPVYYKELLDNLINEIGN